MSSIQQRTAATAIKSEFFRTKLRYAILRAKCQSGKTGAYHCLAKMMLVEGLVENVYLLCGSNELELRSQAFDDAETHNPEYFHRDATGKQTGVLKVFFRQDFATNGMTLEKTLIIVDESHMDQGKKQQLAKFLGRHELTMDGNPATLHRKDAYIVSVSATPYSEEAALFHRETPFPKVTVELEAGEGYFGLEQFKYKGKLHAAFDVLANKAKFQGLLAAAGRRWVLMRLAKCKSSDAVEDWLKTLPGVTVLEFTEKKTEVAITKDQQAKMLKDEGKAVPCLADAPAQTTVVIVRGRLRAGKVVPKQHIAFVWEGARLSKTDSVVQGLAGRMCGYTTAFAGLADVYIPETSLRRDEKKVVAASEIERVLMGAPLLAPTRFTNAKAPRIANKAPNGRAQCPPIALNLGHSGSADAAWWNLKVETWNPVLSELAGGRDDRAEFAEVCVKAALAHKAAIMTNPKLSMKQKVEIFKKLEEAAAKIEAAKAVCKTPNHGVHLRFIHKGDKKSSQHTYFNDLLEHHRDQTCHSHHISDGEPLNFVVCFKDFHEYQSKTVYAVFYTDAAAPLGFDTVKTDARMPHTNGKSIFSLASSTAGVSSDSVAAAMDALDPLTVQCPAALYAALEHRINHCLTAPAGLRVGRCITSVRDRFSMPKAAFNYISKADNDVAKMCEALTAKFGVKVKVKFARGGATHFNVQTIWW